jgi:polyhydroxyalkanoate synthesis regulator phasin
MTTEEFLAERRLRAAELALESARRRVAEADEEIEALRRRIAELEERVLAAAERAGGERAALRAELETERRLRELAEQGRWSERERARGLEDELRRRIDAAATPAAERRLAEAERRAREVRAELELVRHRAAEFEQQVRLAVDAAWRWLGETGERVGASLLELEELRAQRTADPEPDLTAERDPGGGRAEPLQVQAPASHLVADEGIPERFDEALSRLRAQVEPEPPDGSP